MDSKYLVLSGAALVPLIVGFIWYNPRIFGPAWTKASGVPVEKLKSGNMALIFLLTIVCGYFMAKSLPAIVIHQYSFHGMLAGVPEMKDSTSELHKTYQGLMDKYGTNFRTFKHGAWHSLFLGLYLILPILIIIALFERRPWTWVAIHAGYFIISITIMGGIICQFMP